MEPDSLRASRAQALAIYAEALVPGGVVAVLGDSSLGVGDLALRIGARAVCVWDPDPERARAQAEIAPRGVAVRPLAREDLVRRDFDLAIVPDLGLFEDPSDVLADVRRLVGEDGVALVAAANGEADAPPATAAFDYYELFDAVAREFDFVRMIAELPFRGVTLVELGDDADASSGVSVDTQLGDEGVVPATFVALASQRDVRLDPYAIVQLAPVDAAGPSAPEHDAALVEALRERTEASAALQSALEERTAQLGELKRRLDEARAEADAARLASAEELDELIARVDRAERRAADLGKEVARLETEGAGPEHEAIEARLRERAQVIRDLEFELARRERLVRDLAGALEDAGAAPPTAAPPPAAQGEELARLRDRLDALALDLARREGEAQAAAWQNQELARRLELAEQSAAPAPPSVPSDTAARLAAALDELDALRSAFVQEHEARLAAESRSRGGSGAAPTPTVPGSASGRAPAAEER